jgi:hypothetical protein
VINSFGTVSAYYANELNVADTEEHYFRILEEGQQRNTHYYQTSDMVWTTKTITIPIESNNISWIEIYFSDTAEDSSWDNVCDSWHIQVSHSTNNSIAHTGSTENCDSLNYRLQFDNNTWASNRLWIKATNETILNMFHEDNRSCECIGNLKIRINSHVRTQQPWYYIPSLMDRFSEERFNLTVAVHQYDRLNYSADF